MRGGIHLDTQNSTFQNQDRTASENFLDDYSDTQKCCIWSIFSSASNKRYKTRESKVSKKAINDTIASEMNQFNRNTMLESSIKGRKINMNKKLPQMHNQEWIRYLETSLISIEGILWADALCTHIQTSNAEIDFKAQKFRT